MLNQRMPNLVELQLNYEMKVKRFTNMNTEYLFILYFINMDIYILNYLGNAKFRLHDNEGSIRLYSESVICSPVSILKIRKKTYILKNE